MILEVVELSAETIEEFNHPCGIAVVGDTCPNEAKYYALVHLPLSVWSTECESMWKYICKRCLEGMTTRQNTCKFCGTSTMQTDVMGL